MTPLPTIIALVLLTGAAGAGERRENRRAVFVTGCTEDARVADLSAAVSRQLTGIGWALSVVTSAECPADESPAAPMQALLEQNDAAVLFWISTDEGGLVRFYSPRFGEKRYVIRETGSPGDPIWPETTATIVYATLKALDDLVFVPEEGPLEEEPPTPDPGAASADTAEPAHTPLPSKRGQRSRTTDESSETPPSTPSPPEERVLNEVLFDVTYGLSFPAKLERAHGMGFYAGVRLFEWLQLFAAYTATFQYDETVSVDSAASNRIARVGFDMIPHPVWLGAGLVIDRERYGLVPSVAVNLDPMRLEVHVLQSYPPGTTVDIQFDEPPLDAVIQDSLLTTRFNVSIPVFLRVHYRVIPRLRLTASLGVDILLGEPSWTTVTINGEEVHWLKLWPVQPFLRVGLSVKAH